MAEPVVVSKERIATARRDLIICFAWLALAPFALWFATENREHFLLSFIPGIFGVCGLVPLIFSGAVVDEYRDARNGVQSF